jgi:hypothetical protein
MTEGLTPKPPRKVRGRPFEKGRSGNPLGRSVGCRKKTTIAADAALLAGEDEALTRKAVELALVGDPWTEGPRHRQRHDHAGRGGHNSGGVGDA